MTYKNWKIFKLGDLCEFSSEKIETKYISNKNYISTENMLPNKQGVTIASSLPKTKKVNKFEKDDVLISNIRPYFKKIWFANMNGGASNDVLILKNKNKEILDNQYLFYFLSTDHFFNYVTSSAKGTKMPRGDKTAIMKYEILLPPIEEQKKIAAILSTIDKKIKINNKINKTITNIANTIFKYWFIDFEFPNENGEPYKSSGGKFTESELGPIPSDWNIGKLKDISDIIMGQSPSSKTYNTEGKGLGLINGASDFSDGKIHPTKYTTDPKKISQKGDFVFGVRATVGNVTHIDKEYALGRGVAVARPLQPFLKEFLYFQLIKVIDYLEKTSTGSVYINITKSDLENFPIIIPSKRVLKNYHKLVNPFFNKVINNHLENEKLLLMRDNLLPKLMSGEIRVPIESE